MNAIDSFQLAHRHRITPSCLYPLLLVLSGRSRTPVEMAREMGCTASNVTGLLDNLEAGGWVRRVRSPFDRRVWRVEPTEKALEVFAAIP